VRQPAQAAAPWLVGAAREALIHRLWMHAEVPSVTVRLQSDSMEDAKDYKKHLKTTQFSIAFNMVSGVALVKRSAVVAQRCPGMFTVQCCTRLLHNTEFTQHAFKFIR
jgi:hypothetical protein